MNNIVRFIANFFPLIHGVRIAQALFWNKDILEALAVHGGILIVQSAVLCTLAYTQIRKKLIN